jgi:hypothetical protein
MDFFKGNLFKLLLLIGVVIVLGVLHPDIARRILAQGRDLFSKAHSAADSALQHSGAPASPGDGISQPVASPDPSQTQFIVQAYMRKNAAPQCVLSFLDWSAFSASGPTSTITLRYRVQQPFRPDTLATVRFTVQAGAVVKTELLRPGLPPAVPPSTAPISVQRPPIPVRPVQVIDRFSSRLFAAEHGGGMTLRLTDAFSLSQLDQARAKAQAEHKPLGFIMVWGQFFDHEADLHSKASDSALVHFYQVFNDHLVLVFVRHETELGLVPVAVRKGFSGMNEGGYAPNMAVTDATATEFITEIPYRGLDSAGREPIFAEGGRQIDQWLATHPDALPTPAPSAPDP